MLTDRYDMITALEANTNVQAIRFSVNGPERRGTFLGLTTQDGYRYAKVQYRAFQKFAKPGNQWQTFNDLVFLADITGVEVK